MLGLGVSLTTLALRTQLARVFSNLPSITQAVLGQSITYTDGVPPAGFTVTKRELLDNLGRVIASDPPLAFGSAPALTLARAGAAITYDIGQAPPDFAISLLELLDDQGAIVATGTP